MANGAANEIEDDEVLEDVQRKPELEVVGGTAYARMRDRKNPYTTQAARESTEDARQRLPIEYAQRAASVIRKAAKGAKFPNHNIMTLSHVYAYADCGLHVVDSHALISKTKSSGPTKNPKEVKIPRGAKWEQRATTDADLAETFWTGKGDYPPNDKGVIYPYAGPTAIRNVSITFPDGCGQIVLDIDGEEGKKWLREYEAKYGPLPKTPKSITGSGGYHYILLANDMDIRNSASGIAPGVDIRGRNGQILAAPSIHPSGSFYRWEDGCAPWECEIAEAPERLLKLAYEATKGRDGGEKAKSKTKAKAKSKKRAKQRDSGADNAQGFAEHVAQIGDGDGLHGFDTPIYRAACSWWATNPEGEPDELKELLRDAILAAPCKNDRAETRYAPDDYLEKRIEQAREFIAENTPKEHEWIKSPFGVKNGVIYKIGADDNPDRPICQAFNVVGRSSNLNGDGRTGRIITFDNENGIDVELTLDRSDLFKSDGGGILDTLADAGMDLRFSGRNGRADMLDLLRTIKSDRQIPTAPHGGWTRDRAGRVTGFLCPTGEYIPTGDDAPEMRLHSSAMVQDRRPSGSLEGWKEAATAAKHNFYWAFGLCAGFAGSILDLVEGQSCGVHLSGETSLGKTYALLLSTTIWGSGLNSKGLFWVMNSTPNAGEDIATIGSGTIAAMDEVGAMQNPASLGSLLFGLSSNSGKTRKSGRGAGLAETAAFCTFFFMSHERSLKTTIKDAGGDYKTGLSVRFPDVDVTEGQKKVNSDVLDTLDKSKENFGHAGPAFIRYLIAEGWHNRTEDLKKKIADTADEITGDGAAPALRRAAQVFALVWVAGELAAKAELIESAPIKDAVKTAFDAFRNSDEGRATIGGDAMLDTFRSWVVRAQGSQVLVPADDANATGYREARGWLTKDHIILDYECLADMKGMGLSGKRESLIAALKKAGALVMSGKNNIHNSLPPEIESDVHAPQNRKVRNIRIDRHILGV